MKRILSPLLAVMIFAAAIIMPATVFAEDDYVFYEENDVTAYLYNAKTKKDFTCLFREDMDLPYISAEDYLNQVYTEEFSTEENDDGTYTVSNKNGGFVADTEKDTIHFDSFEKVAFYDAKPVLETEKAEYLDKDEFVFSDKKPKGLDLDLGKYNIDIVDYNGSVYLPLTTIADIFSISYQTAIYLDEKIYFSSIMDEKPYYSDKSYYSSVKRDETLIDYTYNELCFVVDNFYGKPSRAKIAESIKSKGLNKSLDEYSALSAEAKKLLKSKDKVDYYFGLLYLDSMFDDGGHTSFSSALSNAAKSKTGTALGDALSKALSDSSDKRMAKVSEYIESQQTENVVTDQIKTARSESYDAYKIVKGWSETTYLIQKDDTVIFVFDSFSDAVVEPFKWSLDYAKEKSVKNFVVDLSCNGGGSSAVAMYMLSVMTGSGDLTMKNTATGNSLTQTAKIDKNLDGKFDKKDDEVKYDLNYAILASQLSFSSGNLMTCLAQERGVKILGETSGGGACLLAKQFFPEPVNYSISGMLIAVNKEGKDIDGGAKPDVELVTKDADGLKDYSGMFKIENINAAIKGDSATQSDTEATNPNETTNNPENVKNVSIDNGIPSYIWILIGVGAAIVLVEVLLYLRRRRMG